MKARLITLFMMFALQSLCIHVMGQNELLWTSGSVVDKQNEPLPGVTVNIKGGSQGVITDVDGKYRIKVPNRKAVLVFSFIGFQTQEVSINGRSTVDVILQETVTQLNDVVIVGYGQQKKESVVAALSTISATGLKQTPASNLGVALAGRLPGLTVLQRSGVPGGENLDFYIRGRSTINGQQPLTIVDGVERSFTALDPHEVETITVLKDASATAVYGVRGANGVIIVTTRRGKIEKPMIDVTVEQAWQQATRLPEMTSAYDYARLTNQVDLQNGRQPTYSDYALERYRLGDNHTFFPVRNYIKEFMKEFSPMQRVNVNVSGGTERMRYFATVGYLYQEGIFKTEKYKEYDYDPESKANRVNFRSNFDVSLHKNLKMFLNISGYMQKKNDPVIVPNNASYLNDVQGYSVMLSNLLSTPNNSHNDLTPDGEVITSYQRANVPYGMLNRTGFRNTQTNQVSATLGVEQKLDFITKGLSAKVVASYDAYSSNQQVRQRTYQSYQVTGDPMNPESATYEPTGSSINSTLSDAQYQSFSNLFDIDASLNYNRTFGKHDITGLILFNRYQRVINIQLPYNYIGLVGRATYGYAHKYLAEVNFGYNGSEQFAPGHKMGFFPSFSIGWVLTEEPFMDKVKDYLSYMKIRASYGQVGNDNMNGTRFAFLTLWGGSYESQIGNKNLEWEKANKYNIGIETRLFKDFGLDVDLFYERRNNILIPATGLIPTGVFGTGGVGASGIIPKINAGVIDNKGMEITASFQKNLNKDFRVDCRANAAFNRNKIIYMSEVLLPEDYACRLRRTGYRLGEPFGYEVAGYFNTEQEILDWYDQTALGPKPKLGDLKYKDKNGDGIVNDKDMVPIGYPEIPEWTFGAGLNIQYKNLDFSMMWQGSANRSYYMTGQNITETYNFNNWHKEAWSQERYDAGERITYPRLDPGSSINHLPSSFWYVNGNYIRLKNMEVGYTLPKKWSNSIRASSIRFYINGLNLLTFDRYPVKYQDPEQSSELLYPVFKTYNVGLNISF